MSTRSTLTKNSTKSKNITRNTTCSSLFDANELEFCCDYCKRNVDVFSHTRKKKKHNNKDKHVINKCSQPWNESYATNYSKALHHIKACECMNKETTIMTQNEHKHNKKKSNSLSSMSQSDFSSESKSSEEKSTGTKTSNKPSSKMTVITETKPLRNQVSKKVWKQKARKSTKSI